MTKTSFKSVTIFLNCLIICLSLPRFPNYLGRGYNIMKGNPLAAQHDEGFVNMLNPFQFQYTKGKTTQDGKFQIPDSSQTIRLHDCSFTQQNNEFSSMEEYTKQIKKRVDISVGGQFDFIKAAFTLSVQYSNVHSTMTQHQTINHNVFVKCYIANIGINLGATGYSFNQDFITLIQNSYKSGDWGEFTDKYGTHFTQWVSFGGRYGEVFQLNTDRMSQINSNGINVNVGISASFFASISSSYNQHTYERSYVETSSTMIRRNKYNIGGTLPNNFNSETWLNSVQIDPQPVQYKLSLWSQAFKYLPKKYFSGAFIRSYETYLSTSYCKRVQCINPDNNKIPKYNYYLAQMRENGCGTSDIHCTDRYDTTSYDRSGLYSLREVHARAGWLFDNHMFVFVNQLTGEGKQVGYNSHDWNFEWVVSHPNIIAQYHEWTNPDCHNGAHQTFIGKAIFRFGDGRQSAQFGTGSCGSWGWEWKPYPGQPFRLCGHYGTRAYPYSVASLCWHDIGLLYCRYAKQTISNWNETLNKPETIYTTASNLKSFFSYLKIKDGKKQDNKQVDKIQDSLEQQRIDIIEQSLV